MLGLTRNLLKPPLNTRRSSSDVARTPTLSAVNVLMNKGVKGAIQTVSAVDLKDGLALDIIAATKANQAEWVASILASDPELRFETDSEDRTALHWATEFGYAYICHLLLAVNPCHQLLNRQDCRGQTALHLACNTRRPDLASYFLNLSPRLDLFDQAGNTVLHRAVRAGLETTAVQLCRAGAAVDTSNQQGWTPLHESARTGSVTVMKALLRLGASPASVTNNTMSPFLTAFFYSKLGAASRGTPSYPDVEGVWKTLIESGCPLSQSDGQWSPLTAALASDSCFIAALLLFNGCLVERPGRWGRSLLQEMFSSSEPTLVKLLVLLGYLPTHDEVAHCSKQIPMYSRVFSRLRGFASTLHRDRLHVVAWLKERLVQPPSLAECSRKSIRAAMNTASGDTPILDNIRTLPIPAKLQRYLALSDFTHYLLT